MREQRIIKAGPKSLAEYLYKVYKYRTLILSIAKRDLKVQYAQTALGILWSAIQPLTGLLIFTVFFDKMMKVDTGEIPYPIFAFSGMVCWYYFTALVGKAGTSLMSAQDLVKKIYFPKLILPLSQVLVGLVEFTISLVLLIGMMLILGATPSPRMLLLPVLVILVILTGLSVALWLSALTIRYRDVNHLIPYLINFGIWLSPVFYPATILPKEYDYVIYFNPMAGLIDAFRWMIIVDSAPSPNYIYSFIVVVILFVTGLIYFKNMESKVSDFA